MVKNILLPVDSSKFMERNVDYACEIAKGMGSKLTLLHIVAIPTPIEGAAVDVEPFKKIGSETLEKAKEIAKGKGIDADTRIETTFGNASYGILNVLESGKFDLVIMGAKGQSLLRNLLVGSVCDTVVHNAPCPVLVVR